ncbi:MAG: DUF4358 domain-containing protein [Oscillospiraceae bacterium]|nr:DUF4358 domain-containing protein [Oscillospiraceae bacterium]
MKNRKKTIISALLSLLLLLGLCACGGNSSASVDIKTLPEAILKQVKFEDQLAEINQNAIENFYDVPDGVTGRVFLGSGATAEEIAVFQAPDEATAKTMAENAKQHISDRIASFENYIPEQVQLLDHAIVKQIGSCVVVCVAADTDSALQVIGG